MSKTYLDIINGAINSFNKLQKNLSDINAYYDTTNMVKSDSRITSDQLAGAVANCAVIKNGSSFVTGTVQYKGAVLNTTLAPGSISLNTTNSKIVVAAGDQTSLGSAGYYTSIAVKTAEKSIAYSVQVGSSSFSTSTTKNYLVDYAETENSGISLKAPTSGKLASDYWKVDISTTPGYFKVSTTSVPIGNTATQALYVSKAALSTTTSSSATAENIALTVNGVSSGSLFVPSIETTAPSGKYIHLNIPEKTSVVSGSFTSRVSTGGYLPLGSVISANITPKTIKTTAKDVYIPITDAESHNGYVTKSGWIEASTENYKLEYDTSKKCVNFIFT